MRKLLIFSGGLLLALLLVLSGRISAQTFSDNASNYGGSWFNGSNQGTGFGAWSITSGANSGTFIGNPANDGMGTSGIGTTAFGCYAGPSSGYTNMNRSLSSPMSLGDTLRFWWSINWDANGGNKGFDLKSGATTVFNVNNNNSATLSTNNGPANTNYGTTPMRVTLIRTSSSTYSFSMTSRSGGANFNTTITSSLAINSIGFYIGAQGDWSAQRNMYFNNFSISKYPPVNASATPGTISCFGGSTTVTVNASGGTPPYSGTGTFTVSAGSYSYTVTDAKGFTASVSGNITQPAALSGTGTATSCGAYTWRGTTYTSSGTYTKTLAATNG
ncbi:MAG: hypothetical protein ACKO1U_09075, partial [Bacteroidota bacterium]